MGYIQKFQTALPVGSEGNIDEDKTPVLSRENSDAKYSRHWSSLAPKMVGEQVYTAVHKKTESGESTRTLRLTDCQRVVPTLEQSNRKLSVESTTSTVSSLGGQSKVRKASLLGRSESMGVRQGRPAGDIPPPLPCSEPSQPTEQQSAVRRKTVHAESTSPGIKRSELRSNSLMDKQRVVVGSGNGGMKKGWRPPKRTAEEILLDKLEVQLYLRPPTKQ